MTTAERIKQITDAAAKFDGSTRISDGTGVAHQGDIYIHRVPDEHKRGAITTNHQLADGSSQGSRHIAVGPITVYRGTTLPSGANRSDIPIGPLVVATGGWTIEHPEHPHWRFPAGTYQITHQIDAITLSAVED